MAGQTLRPAVAYAIVAALTIVMFIALHVVGNRLPFDLAVERFAEVLHASPANSAEMESGASQNERQPQVLMKQGFHFCEFAAVVLADARAARDSGSGIQEAILQSIVPTDDLCGNVRAAVLQGVWFEDFVYANLRHWMGGKALYAIALRYLTVREFHLAIEALTYCGFLSVALALLLVVGWRALLVGAPLLVCGLYLGALEQHSNIADGLPFAWALFATALGTVLLRRSLPMSAARLFFFFAGMVSHYLWYFDGGNFLAATLIGLVVILARSTDSPWQRVVRAAACVGVYAAGFVVSLASRVVLVSAVSEWVFERLLVERVVLLLGRVWTPWAKDMAARDLGTFQMVARIDAPTFDWLLLTAVAALALAAAIAGHRAWRRKQVFLITCLGLGALFVPSCVHFVLPADDPERAARLMFLPLGLSWCCLFTVLTTLPGRQLAAWSGGIVAVLALSYAGTHLAYQWNYETKLARATALQAAQEDGAFAVYLLDTAVAGGEARIERPGATLERELIYRKSPCSGEDLRAEFELHLLAPLANLPDHSRPLGFVNAGFSFYPNGQIFLDTCFASVRVPDYAQGIRTGQSFYIGGRWRGIWLLESDLPM